MPIFFSQRAGAVIRIPARGNQAGRPFRVVLQGTPLGTDAINAIVTGVTVQEEVNRQFLHALDSTTYAYVFGDRTGSLLLQGLFFGNSCDGGPSGMEQIVQIYRENRLTKRPTSIMCSVGSTIYQAFLTGASAAVTDPERQLGEWTFRLNVVPQE